VADLLSLASAEAGALPLHPVRIDLGGWFVDLGRRAGAIAASRGVRLAVTPPGAVPGLVVVADPDRLDQLVLILVDNAIKHSPQAGVVHLGLVDQRRSGLVLVQVADQGPGIPAAELERIFEPFVRVSGTRRSSGGAGLGLAIARQLAVRQGAQLSVASHPGQGATFSLTLRLGA
jgi:two-component system phosphate regulon sensor histidine kinase PhoR